MPAPKLLPMFDGLATAGLNDDLLVRVILRGEAEHDRQTAFDPPTRGGFNRWAEVVRALREELVVHHGWSFSNDSGLCTVISPCGKHAIAAATGDAATGDAESDPQPKYPRGEATTFAVERAQLSLDSLLGESDKPAAAAPQLWMLLMRRTTPDEVRAEVSQVEHISEGGYVLRWRERHVLPPIALAPVPSVSPVPSEVEVDVPVRRKNG